MSSNEKKAKGRFYVEGDLAGREATLSGTEAAHAAKSKRLVPGDVVELFNGSGSARCGTIQSAARGTLHVVFIEPVRYRPPPECELTIASSPPKGDRMKLLVEKLSELNASSLIPVVFSRSIDAGVVEHTGKLARWRRTAMESAKQCGRNILLDVERPALFRDLSPRLESYGLKIILVPMEHAAYMQNVLDSLQAPPESVLVLVGPEGGYTPEEESLAKKQGFVSASLGKLVLRIETAALAAAAVIRARWD